MSAEIGVGAVYFKQMLIYLYGPDAYRRSAKASELMARFSKKNPPVLNEVFAFDDSLTTDQLRQEVGRCLAFLGNQSLFGGGVLAHITELKQTTKELLGALKREALNEDANRLILVSVIKKLPKEFAFLEKPPARIYDFPLLSGKKFVDFLRDEAKRRGLSVKPIFFDQVARQYEGDLWLALTELERLSLGGGFQAGHQAPDFFALIQRIKGTSALSTRLSALTMALEKEEPAAIFNVLASLVSGETKVLMADYDLAVKAGKLEYDDALLDFVLGGQLFSEARL